MRYDYFLIWGNGVYHTDEIIKIIDDEDNFKTIYIKEIIFDDIEEFIKGIYKCDTVPWEHLISKSRYLLSSPKKVILLLTENLEPDEKYFGGGAFRHIQCQKVKDLKTIIRNKFNPPFSDINKKVEPLDIGISHEHVIHGSDYESQVDYTLDYLKLPNLDFFKKFSNKVDVRQILSDMPTYCVIKKWDDFPNYMGFNDVDIVCNSRVECLNHIMKIGKGYQDKGWKIEITNNVHCHIDFIPPGSSKLDFRFDLIDNFNSVYNTKLKKEFMFDVLENRIVEDGIYIPKLEHDLSLRYLEYKEQILQRPDKIKHLNYCKKFTIDYESELNKYKL